MSKDKYCGEVYLELTFWSNVNYSFRLFIIVLLTVLFVGTCTCEEGFPESRYETELWWTWHIYPYMRGTLTIAFTKRW